MEGWIFLGIAIFLIIATLVTSYVCFYRIFYSPRKNKNKEEYPIPDGEIYEPFREIMVDWMKNANALPHKNVEIRSFDGLTLRGKFYEYEEGAPIELMFHGYKGDSYRDLSGGIARCFALKRSVLIVDHRGSGRSDGKVITFGINESKDCIRWIDFILENIDKNAKIILTGISMGAATVLIAASQPLPKNVVGVLADCGYTSAKAIIKKVITEMRLPANLLYPFVKLGARLFGNFNVDEISPIESMQRCRLPVIFFHGDTDDFVPCEMSKQNYDACVTEKKMVVIQGAGHGLCFPVAQEQYLEELKTFFDPILNR